MLLSISYQLLMCYLFSHLLCMSHYGGVWKLKFFSMEAWGSAHAPCRLLQQGSPQAMPWQLGLSLPNRQKALIHLDLDTNQVPSCMVLISMWSMGTLCLWDVAQKLRWREEWGALQGERNVHDPALPELCYSPAPNAFSCFPQVAGELSKDQNEMCMGVIPCIHKKRTFHPLKNYCIHPHSERIALRNKNPIS